eukprot:gene11204-15028_t
MSRRIDRKFSAPKMHQESQKIIVSNSTDDKTIEEAQKLNYSSYLSPTSWIWDKKNKASKSTSTDSSMLRQEANPYNHYFHDARIRESMRKSILFSDSEDELEPFQRVKQRSNSNTENNSCRIIAHSQYQAKDTQEQMNSNQTFTASSAKSNIIPFDNHSISSHNQDNYFIDQKFVAPNVSKLSAQSAVEVKLQSRTEIISVLCAVDVLKMRSHYFYDYLSEQEKNDSTKSMNAGLLWREPIIVDEEYPYDAASFLESLHEARSSHKGDWNMVWARLSVAWQIEDLIQEYQNQIECHINKVLQIIKENHWRTNPRVLQGMKVAVFKKGSNATPSIILGIAVECSSSIGYSKLKVKFDDNHIKPIASKSLLHKNIHHNDCNVDGTFLNPSEDSIQNDYNLKSSTDKTTSANSDDFLMRRSENNITNLSLSASRQRRDHHQDNQTGDISAPFWVKSHQEYSLWIDPDDLFINCADSFVSATDTKIFWEMCRTILNLPELVVESDSMIKTSHDLTEALKSIENKILWSPENADHLPRSITSELITHAYVLHK